MNEVGDYEDIDMHGLDPVWYESVVPVGAQRSLIAAFPELRLIWNQPRSVFQIVHRQPGWREAYYGGCCLMVGWSIIPGDYEPPLSMDSVLGQLHAREHVAVEETRRLGFETFSDRVDFLYDQMVKKEQEEIDRRMNETLGLDVENQCVRPRGGLLSESTQIGWRPTDNRSLVNVADVPALRGLTPWNVPRRARKAQKALVRA